VDEDEKNVNTIGMQKERTFNYAEEMLKQWDAMSTYRTVDVKEFMLFVWPRYEAVGGLVEIAVDTETTGVDTLTCSLLGYSFSFKPNEAYWVPIANDPQLRLLRTLTKGALILMFNAVFDMQMLRRYGLPVKIDDVRDVMVACFHRDTTEYKENRGLKDQARLLLSLPTITLKDIIASNLNKEKITEGEIDFTLLTPDQQRIYGCQDADITMQIWRDKRIQIAIQNAKGIWDIDTWVIDPVIEMAQNGVGFDAKRCAELDTLLETEAEKCRKDVEIYAMEACDTVVDDKTGATVFAHPELRRLTKKTGLNLGSFRQKQILLFDVMGLPPTRKVKSGYSTDQDALSEIAHVHPIVPAIMRYAKTNTRRTIYTQKLPTMVNPLTGRIHPSLWHVGVVSGRFSCTNPNMQGISKDDEDTDVVHVREVFVPAKGNVLTSADYSQMELRVVASLSREPKWIDAYYDPKFDVHVTTARDIFKTDTPTEVQRRVAKRINFSVLTGVGGERLYVVNRGAIASVEEAIRLIKTWNTTYNGVYKWIQEIYRQGRVQGYMDTYFGRRRMLPEIQKPTPATTAQFVDYLGRKPWAHRFTEEELWDVSYKAVIREGERAALSHIIQGTAADIMKIALINVYAAIVKSKLPIKMLLAVHDEIVFEHPAKITEQAHALIRENMEFPEIGPGWVPLTVDIGCGKNWANAK